MSDLKQEMAQRVKVHNSGGGGIDIKEVDAEEARRILSEARAQGRLVINKRTGDVIEDLKPDVEELLIVDIVGGG